MSAYRKLAAACLTLAAMAAGCHAWAASPDVYAYVVLGYSPGSGNAATPMARVIVAASGQACPTLTPVAPGPGTAALNMTARTNPSPANFPVTVCEALYPSTGQRYTVTGVVTASPIVLPGAAIGTSPSRVVVFGDSGCYANAKQPCDPSSWPFPAIAALAASESPQLLIHAGDYNYSGTPSKITINGNTVRTYDAGDSDDDPGLDPPPPNPYYSQNMTGSSLPDSWAPWRNDFFAPAGAALTAAPWIFVRGNHELCRRAGPGYFYFLDSGSTLLGSGLSQNVCPDQNGSTPLVFVNPYPIWFGKLNIIVVDSTNADDEGVSYPGVFNPQLASVASLAIGAPGVWVATHRPFWGVQKGDDGGASVINQTLESALSATTAKAFPANVSLVVSGHMHHFQAIGFLGGARGGRPPQFIAGTGGVQLSKEYPKQTGKTPFSMTVDGTAATGVGLTGFGLMRIDFGGGGSPVWDTAKFIDQNGKTKAECSANWASGKPKPAAVCVLK